MCEGVSHIEKHLYNTVLSQPFLGVFRQFA